MKNPDNIKKIVILRTDRIGEVLLTTPLIEALKEKFPQAQISFVTSPYARDIISDRADLKNIILFDTIKEPPLLEAFSLAGILRKHKFDLAVIVNPHKVLHLGCFLAGIKYRIGFDRKWSFLLTHKIEDKKSEGRMHEVEYNLELLKTIGIEKKEIAPSIPVTDESASYIESLLKKFGADRVIVIHPGSSNPDKRWPAKNFRELIRKLSADGKVTMVVGDSSEKVLCHDITSGISDNVHNFCAIFSLKQLTALLKRADMLITNDNGPMHIAAAVGTKVIAIFGRDIPGVGPKRWGPYGKGHIVFHKDIIQNITVDEVYEAISNS